MFQAFLFVTGLGVGTVLARSVVTAVVVCSGCLLLAPRRLVGRSSCRDVPRSLICESLRLSIVYGKQRIYLNILLL